LPLSDSEALDRHSLSPIFMLFLAWCQQEITVEAVLPAMFGCRGLKAITAQFWSVARIIVQSRRTYSCTHLLRLLLNAK